MPASTEKANPEPSAPEAEPTGVTKAADDTLDHRDKISAVEDQEATKWYLAPQPEAPEWTIPFDWFDHDKGEMIKREWAVRPLPAEVLEAIEEGHRSKQTGLIDSTANNAEVLAKASISPDPTSEEFRTANGGRASAADAVSYLFRHQSGVIDLMAGEIRRISGYDASRVGTAKPRLARAAGNS